jgi:hypothetical protein
MKQLILLWMSIILIGATFPAMAQEGPETTTTDKPGGVKSIEDRLQEVEEAIGRQVLGDKWYDRIEFGGLIEVEAGYGEVDFKDPAEVDEEFSDVDLATVELDLDARIVDHVDGHVRFKYEDDDVFLDDGFITLFGSESFPAYLIAGRQYVPFGNYDSFFVTDPNTLVLGETNEGAAVIGYRFGGELVDISAGAFNGKIDEIGDDDAVDSYLAAVTVQPIEGLMFGASYISNLASSDTFSEFVTDRDGDDEIDPIADLVDGWSAFVAFEFLGRIKIIGEYVAALDEFRAGELYDPADPIERKPEAWNVELGVGITDTIEVAARYGGSDDGGADFLPEKQYGAVVNWGFFDSTNLAIEYLHGEFEDDVQETDSVIAQLAIEF